METYVAEPERPVDKCLADVAACDLYIGVFAWRYGYVPSAHARSITELEYRTAIEHDKPCLIFLLDEDAPWPRSSVEKGLGADRIEELRTELLQKHTCSFFTSCQDLAALVTAAVSNWLATQGQLVDGHGMLDASQLTAYYERLQQQYTRLDLDALTPPQREEYLQIHLQSVFVEPSVREDLPPLELPKELWHKLLAEETLIEHDLPTGIDLLDAQRAQDAYWNKQPRRILDVIAEPNGQGVVLLGDPGAGKSTLARYLVLSLTTLSNDQRLAVLQHYLPILIELRSYAGLKAKGTCSTFLEFLDHLGRTEGLGLDHDALEAYLTRDGRALVIFDGLDEVFDPQDRDEIARQIAGFAYRYPKARVLVTSRVIGYRRARLTDAGFTHYTLQDLNEDQISEFLTSWYTLALHDRPDEALLRRERLLAAIRQFRAVRELAGNPLLLTILAIIGKHQELPRERWKVYDHAAAVLVQHWDVNRHLHDQRIQHDFLGEEDKKELLRRIAYRMQAGTGGLAGNYLTAEELREEFEGYLVDRYQQDLAQAKVIAVAMLAQFRERNFILSRYGPGVYGFVHRAFLEYFCAWALVWRFEKSQELSADQLRHELFGKHWSDTSWWEVLRLIVGMIDERHAGDLIAFLASDAYQPWPLNLEDRPPNNVALAVQCLGELRNLGAVTEQAELVLRVVISLLEYSFESLNFALSDMLQGQLLPAVEILGSAWPGRDSYLNWYRSHGSRSFDSLRGITAAEIAAILFPESRELRDLFVTKIGSHGYFANEGATQGLARLASINSDTLAWLRDRATNDRDPSIRRAAISAIGRAAPDDPDTLRFLRDWATKGKDAGVRQAAVNTIGRTAPDDPDTLTWLRDLATNNRNPNIRQAAVNAIGQAPGDPDTLAWLRSLATKDENPRVRRAAARAVIGAKPADPRILAWLPTVSPGQSD